MAGGGHIHGVGFYVIGMNNRYLDNRAAGFETGIYTNGGSSGQGPAAGLSCPIYTRFERFERNVMHDCRRWGLYLGNQMARNVVQDADGFVRDRSTCEEFDANGRDNGAVPATVVADEFDWHVGATGLYALRDVRWLRYTGVNNGASVYWKTSKAMADGGAHIQDSKIVRIRHLVPGYNDFGCGCMMGPSGPFTFLLQNVSFVRGDDDTEGALIKIGQHCGLSGHNGGVEGQLCSVQYFLKAMEWKSIPGSMQRIQFGVSGGNPITPILTTDDASLGGAQSLISPLLRGFALLPGCNTTGLRWSYATACAQRARRLALFGEPQWNAESSGLPTDVWSWPSSLRQTGIHSYKGKAYYIRCAFNGCRPWNREAYELEEEGQQGAMGRNWSRFVHQFAYRQLRLRGPGYDGVAPTSVHHRADWPSNLFETMLVNGADAGLLTYDVTHGGYSAVVLEGNGYSLEDTDPGFPLAMAFSDPFIRSLTPSKTVDVLPLCVKGGGPFRADGSDAACWLTSEDDRSWLKLKGGLEAKAHDPRYEVWATIASATVPAAAASRTRIELEPHVSAAMRALNATERAHLGLPPSSEANMSLAALRLGGMAPRVYGWGMHVGISEVRLLDAQNSSLMLESLVQHPTPRWGSTPAKAADNDAATSWVARDILSGSLVPYLTLFYNLSGQPRLSAVSPQAVLVTRETPNLSTARSGKGVGWVVSYPLTKNIAEFKMLIPTQENSKSLYSHPPCRPRPGHTHTHDG